MIHILTAGAHGGEGPIDGGVPGDGGQYLTELSGKPSGKLLFDLCTPTPGRYLPSLRELRLTSSVVPCLRDLGTSLSSVAVLWMVQCRLKDLDGPGALNGLRVQWSSVPSRTQLPLL